MQCFLACLIKYLFLNVIPVCAAKSYIMRVICLWCDEKKDVSKENKIRIYILFGNGNYFVLSKLVFSHLLDQIK